MKTVLQFLRDLAQHNDRAWFNEHKERYLAVQQRWNEFCESLIGEIGAFDPDIARLTLRDCTYRIYRDTRFSPDKSPYKTHFGVFLAPGGKKSMHAGYYFHVGTGESTAYPLGTCWQLAIIVTSRRPSRFCGRTSVTDGRVFSKRYWRWPTPVLWSIKREL